MILVPYTKSTLVCGLVQNKVEETRDSMGARGNPIIHDCMDSHIHIQDSTTRTGYGEHTPNVVSFIKVCNGHTQGTFLMFRVVGPLKKEV